MPTKPYRSDRFKVIPREYDGCLYAVELTNGVVKIGWSRNPRTRMSSLQGEVRRAFGSEIARFFIGRNISNRAACLTEVAVLRRMGRIGSAIPGHREFFTGVGYGAAVNLVSQFSARAPADKAVA